MILTGIEVPTAIRDIAEASAALKSSRLIVWASGQRYLFAPNMAGYAAMMIRDLNLKFDCAEYHELIAGEWIVNREKSDESERHIRKRCGQGADL